MNYKKEINNIDKNEDGQKEENNLEKSLNLLKKDLEDIQFQINLKDIDLENLKVTEESIKTRRVK